MTYEAVFLNTFLKQFKKLTVNLRERVRQRVQELAEDPYLGIRLGGHLEGFWKDRVGDYRIIYKVEESARRVVFYDVDLRKKSTTSDRYSLMQVTFLQATEARKESNLV